MRKTLLHFLAVLPVCITLGLQETSAQAPTPILSKMEPSSVLQGAQNLQIALRGKNFVAGQTTVAINPSTGVTIGVATVTNSAQLTVSFTIDAAVPGERFVTVTTPNGT